MINGVLPTYVLAGRAFNQRKELDDVFGKPTLAKALRKWTRHGGDLHDVLSSSSDQPVKSKAEATAICEALDALRAESDKTSDDIVSSPLHTLTGFFQKVETREAFDILERDGLPRLRSWVGDLLDGRDINVDTIMFVMKILAIYRQREDVELLVRAARRPINAGGYMWSVILGLFDGEHPYSVELIEALRDPLPTGFLLVTYLDMANGLAIAERLDRHPFDSPAGRMHLAAWLRDTREEKFSYARSATAALPFIEQSSREVLLKVAHDHADPSIRMEAAWSQAKSGDPAGFDRLAEFCLDPRHSQTAQQYLEELGQPARIAGAVQRADFQAVAEMANWLGHPNEFGRPPDTIELLDTRELFWPPTNDRRQLSLVEYTYNDGEGGDPDCGVGMVGSVTFALFGEATAEMTPEDVYSLHCCRELEWNDDSRAPEECTARAGREILRRYNDDL